MGLDVYGQLIVGIRIKEGDFWTADGKERRCPRCLKARPSGQFCSDCGGRVCEVPKREAAPALLRLCRDGEHPHAAWDRLREKGEEGIGVHEIEGVIDGGASDHEYALGLRLGRTHSSRDPDRDEVCAVTVAQIQEADREVSREATRLGLMNGRAVEIFTTVYLSY